MKMHTRLLMAMLAGAIVTACSNPQASGTRIQVAPQREAPATRPASVPEIPLPLETPPKLETLMETTPAQGPESSSTAPTRRAAIPVGTPIAVRTIEPIDSRTDPAGQTYRAVIDADITADNVAVIPKGSDARLKLTHVFPDADFDEEITIHIELDRIVVGVMEYTVSSGLLKQGNADARVRTPGEVVAVGSEAIIGVDRLIVPPGAQLIFRIEQPLEIGGPYPILVPNRTSQSGPRKLGEEPASQPITDTEKAVDVSGEWNLLLENHRGARSVKLWLKQDGSTLTGNILDPTTGDLRLHGNVTGQSVRFSTEKGIQGGAERSEYSGTIWSSRLAGTVIVRTTPKPTGPKRVGMPQMSASERSYMWSARPVRE